MSETQKTITQVRCWIEKAVIGLNLCPFAKSVYQQNEIRFIVSKSEQVDRLMLELYQQCQYLIETPGIETTLLIIPYQLKDFGEFNQILDQVDMLIEAYEWGGVFQIASFHPKYQFHNTNIEDRENWTNRSPLPILQILRETGVERALSGHPDPHRIPEKNIRKLTEMDSLEFDRVFDTN